MSASADTTHAVQMWPTRRVYRNPLNPRGEIALEALDELTASVRAVGIISPLLVTPHRDGYAVTVVYGHRRLAAAQGAGLAEVPVIVNRFTEQEQLELMLIENLQRQDLTPIEEARGYARALEGAKSQADLARRLGVSANRIGWRLELLRLDEAVQTLVHRRELPASLARPLLKIEDPREQRRVARMALKRTFSPGALADFIAARQPAPSPAAAVSAVARTPQPRPTPPPSITRSEARAMIEGEGVVSYDALRAALDDACETCDEQTHPEICRACPLPQFIPSLLREIERGQQGR